MATNMHVFNRSLRLQRLWILGLRSLSGFQERVL
jgi:hypothetical protein